MNGFLVVLCGMIDDLPLSLHATREEAQKIADSITVNDSEMVEAAAEIMRRDFTYVSCVAIAEFRDGLLVAWDVVHDFDDEEEEDA